MELVCFDEGEIRENDGKWRKMMKMTENDGKWRKMTENDEKWRKMTKMTEIMKNDSIYLLFSFL